MKRFSRFVTQPRFSIIGILVIAAISTQAQVERTFTVPLSDLKTWSENVVVPFKAKVTGHSAVHPVASDCEMHMGANLAGFNGAPTGWVLEPMNLCLEFMPDKGIRSKKDWEDLGTKIASLSVVSGSGVPRLWPEHLKADPAHADSNPAHATEMHPLLAWIIHVFRDAKASSWYKPVVEAV